MARIRTVKPEYPQHRKVRKVSRDARLLNIHLWNLADDEGRLQELIPWIIGAVFPADEDVTPAVLRGWLDELTEVGLVHRYEVDGEHYIQCHDWADHQKISHPSKSTLPPYTGDSGGLPEDSGNAPGDLPEDSDNAPGTLPEDSGGERKGKEGKGREHASRAARAREGIPDHLARVFAELDHVAFARSRPSPDVPAVLAACERYPDRDHVGEAQRFRRYYTAGGAGENRRVRAVAASWDRWLETAPSATTASKARSGRAGSAAPSLEADLAELEAEHARIRAEEAEAPA